MLRIPYFISKYRNPEPNVFLIFFSICGIIVYLFEETGANPVRARRREALKKGPPSPAIRLAGETSLEQSEKAGGTCAKPKYWDG